MGKRHAYTEREKEFMAGCVPGRSYREIREAFAEEFGWGITTQQVKSYIGNHGLSTGRTGRFEKGRRAHNKGKKGACAAGSEKGWFKKGHTPKNHKPVGSERVNRDGYTEIKTREPDVWELKHREIWEGANGKIPDGCVLLFKDGDKGNMALGNLLLVKKSVNAIMSRAGLHKAPGELKETAVRIAELKEATGRKIKKDRLGRKQGELAK